jgi:hypothetical protein
MEAAALLELFASAAGFKRVATKEADLLRKDKLAPGSREKTEYKEVPS